MDKIDIFVCYDLYGFTMIELGYLLLYGNDPYNQIFNPTLQFG